MPYAPPLFTAFIRKLEQAVADTKAEFKMSVQVKGLADIVRDAKKAIDTAGTAASRLKASATAVVNTIGQVDDMTRQLDAANADLTAAVGAMSNGGPPLEDTANSDVSSHTATPVPPAPSPVADIHAAKVIVEAQNAPAYVTPPVVTASTIAAANAAAAMTKCAYNTLKPLDPNMNINDAASLAKDLIDGEVANQNKMWGDANERADHTKGQLLMAGVAQATAVAADMEREANARDMDAEYHEEARNSSREIVFNNARDMIYPDDWSGFRDYGSDVANLVVAAAYIQNEIKRRLFEGEDYTRSKRRPDQPYNPETWLPR